MSLEQSEPKSVGRASLSSDNWPTPGAGRSDRALLAGAMPWVLSGLFHLGLFLVMVLLVFVVLRDKPLEQAVVVPDTILGDAPGPTLAPREVHMSPSATSVRPKHNRPIVGGENLSLDVARTTRPVDLPGLGTSPSVSAARMGMTTAGVAGPRSSFFGTGGNAHNVVYVIDRSGSMVNTFNRVRMEMLRSVGRLDKTQRFHIVLFGEGKPIENKPGRLVAATRKNKKQAARFLGPVLTEGNTQPIPALRRAFAVLQKARKPGRMIYLLTDADFRGNHQAVLHAIRRMNLLADRRVYIHTFMFGAEAPEAVKVMKQIAEEHGGKYTFVPADG